MPYKLIFVILSVIFLGTETIAQAQVTPAVATLGPSQQQQFSVGGQQATWSIVPAGLGTITPTGLYTAPAIYMGDEAYVSSEAHVYAWIGPVSYEAQVLLLPTVGVGSSAPSAPIAISVSPSTAYLNGLQSQQFTASVTGSPNQQVVWAIIQGPGIITNGLYSAVSPVNVDTLVTISATSAADPTKSASATILLEPEITTVAGPPNTLPGPPSPAPVPSLPPSSGPPNPSPAPPSPAPVPSLPPSSGPSNPSPAPATPVVTPATSAPLAPSETLQFVVANLPSGGSVTWKLSPALGSISTRGLYTAPNSIVSQQTVVVTASDAVTTATLGTASLTLAPTSISPATATLGPGGIKQFTLLNLPAGTNVGWGVNSANGSISATGLYTAPSIVSSQQTFTISAFTQTSANPLTLAVLATASVTVTTSLPTSVSPATSTVAPTGSRQFSVLNLPSGTNAAWTLTPAVGTITASGLYTAPNTVGSKVTLTVTAKNSSTQAVLGSASLTLTASPASPTSLNPSSATVAPAGTKQFTIVNLPSGTNVTWSTSPVIGSISQSGLYTAPTIVASQQVITVTATNSSTQTALGTATVTITATGSSSNVIVYPTDPPYGARCDGVTDDAPAIQAAIDSLGSTGGTVHLISCSHPYLLNSYHLGRSLITYNLLIGSNITLEGDPGAELLQGPEGVATQLPSYIDHVVLEFSRGGNAGCFDNIVCNGGFYPLHATEANSPQVTLSDASRTSLFQAGDYVMIYAGTSFPYGIIPGEPNIVTSVDESTGALSVEYPLARSFSSPYIVRVTSQATWNVGLKNLIIQGWKPLHMFGTFNAVIQGNTFIHDQTYIHMESSGMVELCSVRQVLFQDNVLQGGTGPLPTAFQIPDQNGMNVTFDSDTFYTDTGMNFGSEYAAHITVQNSHMFISGDSISQAAVVVGGVDATFSGNDVHATNWTNPRGIPTAFSDYNAGGNFYIPYNGQIVVENNTFDCATPNLSVCVMTVLPQTTLTNNQISAAGTLTMGIYAAAGNREILSQSVVGNQISMAQGDGIVLAAAPTDAAVIQGNTIQSSGGRYCISVASPASGVPDSGSDIISGNTTSGCKVPVQINMSLHPGTSIVAP
jgi:hypothetical protein